MMEVEVELQGKSKVPSNSMVLPNRESVNDGTFDTSRLLEEVLERNNMLLALKRVISNKGSHGVDGMKTDELREHIKKHWHTIKTKLLETKYNPSPVRRVEIPKADGGVRLLGIPTVQDRLIQQAIAQILSRIYEPSFSDNSFGFRPQRGARNAIMKSKEYINQGNGWVIDMDLEKFFDTVCQSKLIEILSRTIKDGKVISLIHKYLNAGVISNSVLKETTIGMPQGGPLSPLLSNIMLNELDKELAKRGHRFVRYADDLMIFCKSKRSANRTLESIVPFIEKKLYLKVNIEKTTVAHISKVKYLGYAFYRYKGECRLRVHKKSITKMQARLRELTKRSNGWGNEFRQLKLTQFIRGWINYFSLADMKYLLLRVDEWLRRKIRAIYWKQWKKVKTRYKMIQKYQLPEWKVHEMANCRKGIWRSTIMLNSVLTNKEIANLGYITLTDYYLKVCEN